MNQLYVNRNLLQTLLKVLFKHDFYYQQVHLWFKNKEICQWKGITLTMSASEICGEHIYSIHLKLKAFSNTMKFLWDCSEFDTGRNQ